ncbi:MAG: hypothetical protein AAGE52_23375 [Myxococcota bacterium]
MTIEQRFMLPTWAVQEMSARATKTDRSLSWLAGAAWDAAADEIAKRDRSVLRHTRREGFSFRDKEWVTLQMSAEMHGLLEQHAKRFDTNLSSVLVAAWVLGSPAIA